MCLVEQSKNSKGKDKRLEEKEKLEAELERSLAVAKVKSAHKQIEDTEKSRKRSVVLSICQRIYLFHKQIAPSIAVLNKPEFKRVQITEEVLPSIESFNRAYTSISYDFQKSLDVGEEAMTKMFPTIEFKKDTVSHAVDGLLSICQQLQQMRAYCERLLV
jgi:ribosomal protein S19